MKTFLVITSRGVIAQYAVQAENEKEALHAFEQGNYIRSGVIRENEQVEMIREKTDDD